MTEIRVRLNDDWGCEYTATDSEAYEAACLAAIREIAPGADIDLESVGTRTSVSVDGDRHCALADDIYQALQQVWDDGDFWTAA